MTVPDSRRVLTVRQPWADLIMAGVKDVENRTRPVPSTLPHWSRCHFCGVRRMLDGPGANAVHDCSPQGTFWPDGPFPFLLWIHAARYHEPLARPGIAEDWCALADAWGLDPAAYGHRIGALAMQRVHDEGRYGAVLGPVTVVGQHHADGCRERTILNPDYPDWPRGEGEIVEEVCSPWAEPDRWHIQTTDPQPLDWPIPMRGRQGWWRLPDDLEVAS